MSKNPIVFISHSSKDKARFVTNFASKLRAKGIDVWYDEWEILPGDSLVDKIFEEGIKEADAIVVVVSKNSVDSSWVREELNAAVIKKINRIAKLIPIIIDEVRDENIPESIKSTAYEKIQDLNNYDSSLERIYHSIFNKRERPALGNIPSYIDIGMPRISGLQEADIAILKASCEEYIKTGRPVIKASDFLPSIGSLGIGKESFLESLEVLEHNYYIKQTKFFGDFMPDYKIEESGFEVYLQVFHPEYEQLWREVALQIVNQSKENSKTIAEALNQPQVVIEHVLDNLEKEGHLKVDDSIGPDYRLILSVKPTLKRLLQ